MRDPPMATLAIVEKARLGEHKQNSSPFRLQSPTRRYLRP